MNKQRLVKILEDVLQENGIINRNVDKMANLLIEKGVIAPPIPIGSKIYIVHRGIPKISEAKVVGYHITYGNYDSEEVFREWLSIAHYGCIGSYSIDCKRLGKNVFLDEQEAFRYKEVLDARCKKFTLYNVFLWHYRIS